MRIEKLKTVLLKYEFIEFALVFGSFASGKNYTLSDVDVAIQTSEKISLLTLGELIATVEDELLKKVDLVVINELYKENPRLAYNITTNHKLLFCKDKKKYHDFKTQSFLYYFDTKFMYDMFDNKLKERLKDGTFGKIKTS